MEYKRKVDIAIRLLRAIPQDGPVELSYSGGKDSDVILELARMSGIKFEAIYKNTTIDPPGTIKHCRENGVTILQPKETFFQLMERKGPPNRWAHFCCEALKEYKVHDRAIQGIRRAESNKRAARYKEPEICRTYPKGEKDRIYFPILEWELEDVARFVEERQIKLAPAYYDKEGTCHFDRRLGCIGCPLASIKKRRQEFLDYPKMLRLWMLKTKQYMDAHPSCAMAKKNASVWEKFYGDLFFESFQEYKEFFECQIFPFDAKGFLERYFNIDLTL